MIVGTPRYRLDIIFFFLAAWQEILEVFICLLAVLVEEENQKSKCFSKKKEKMILKPLNTSAI